MNTLTVCIPHKSDSEVSKIACTLTALAQNVYRGLEVLVHDSSEVSFLESRTNRAVWDYLSMRYPTRILRSKDSPGIVEAQRRLLEATSTPLFMRLDDDILISPATISELVELARHILDWGCICPVILDIDNYRGYDDWSLSGVDWEDMTTKDYGAIWYRQSEGYEVIRAWKGVGGCFLARTDDLTKYVKFDFHADEGGDDLITTTVLAQHSGPCYIGRYIPVYQIVNSTTTPWNWSRTQKTAIKNIMRAKGVTEGVITKASPVDKEHYVELVKGDDYCWC